MPVVASSTIVKSFQYSAASYAALQPASTWIVALESKLLFDIVGGLVERTVTELRFVQPLNASSQIVVTDFGIVIEFRPEQPENAA